MLQNFLKYSGFIKDKTYWYNLGEEAVSSINYNEAMKCYIKALSLDPSFVDGWNARGYVLFLLFKYEEAIRCFDKALEICENNIDALSNKGLTLYKIAEYEQAIEYYDKVLQLKPDYPNAWNNREKIAKFLLRQKIMNIAREWVGKHFNEGQIEQCCYFVRHVFSIGGKELPVTKNPSDNFFPTDESYANSLAGDEVGIKIEKISDLIEGDLIFFRNTYGEWPSGTITHVAIYAGGGEFIHRSTSSEPVEIRSLQEEPWREKFTEGRRIF
jgi:tetratricopeptide (TPR) repeat protein